MIKTHELYAKSHIISGYENFSHLVKRKQHCDISPIARRLAPSENAK